MNKYQPGVESLENRRLLTTFEPVLLADITPGITSTDFNHFFPTESRLYFNANGHQFWQTDGTSSGTNLLVEGTARDTPIELSNGLTLFNINIDGSTDVSAESLTSVWRTDGTAEGTSEIIAGRRSLAAIVVNDDWTIARFLNQETLDLELWRIGAQIGDAELLHTLPEAASLGMEFLVDGDVAYVSSINSRTTIALAIRTEGTAAGTSVLSETLTAHPVLSAEGVHFAAVVDAQQTMFRVRRDTGVAEAQFTLPRLISGMRAFNGNIMLFAPSPSQPRNYEVDWIPWITDGTESGSISFPDLTMRDPTWYDEFNDVLLFGGPTAKVMRTDGTPEGTHWLSDSAYLGRIGKRAYLGKITEVTHFTDGTSVVPSVAFPPEPVRPIGPLFHTGFRRRSAPGSWWHFQEDYVLFSNRRRPIKAVYVPDESGTLQMVVASDGIYLSEVLRVDDDWYTVESALVQSPIDAHVNVSVPERLSREGQVIAETHSPRYDVLDSIRVLSTIRESSDTPLYFTYGSQNDAKLFALHGDMVVESIGDFESLSPNPVGSDFFFTRDTPDLGVELWATDGTAEGTVPIDIFPGKLNSRPEFVSWQGGTIVIASSSGTGKELWAINGSFSETPYQGYHVEIPAQIVPDAEGITIRANLVGELDTESLTFLWDLNDDGNFGDATGQSARLTWQQVALLRPAINTEGSQPIHLRVVDRGGAATVHSSFVTLRNAPPIVAGVSIPDALTTSQSFRVTVLAHDLIDGERLTYVVDFGDGTLVEQTSPTVSHSYANMGIYNVEVIARDRNAGETRSTHQITVSPERTEESWLFEPGTVFGGNEQTMDVDLGDDDGDGRIDKVFETVLGDWNRFRSIDNGNVRHIATIESSLHADDRRRHISTAVARVSGDEQLDFAVATLHGLQEFDGGTWTWTRQGSAGPAATDVAFADLNGDDALDLFVANSEYVNGFAAHDRVFLNTKPDSFRFGWYGRDFEPTTQVLGPYKSQSVELGDVNGDGSIDAVTASLDSVHFWFNDGQAHFIEGSQQLEPGGNHVAVGDLDGDGDLDLFAAAIAENRVYLNDGTGRFVDSGQRLGTASSSHVALGDLDLDGDLDAFVTNRDGEPNRVWLNDGPGEFSDSGARLGIGVRTERVALGDIDFDGDLDAVIAVAGAPNRVYLNSAATVDPTPPRMIVFRTEMNDEGRLESITMDFNKSVSFGYGSIHAWNNTRVASPWDLSWNESRTRFVWDTGPDYVRVGTYDFTIEMYDALGQTLEGGFPRTLVVTRDGDFNRDLSVDIADFVILAENFGQQIESESEGDIDGDGRVSFNDFLKLARNFGKS